MYPQNCIPHPPFNSVPRALAAWLTETGPLTAKLLKTGRPFTVTVLEQGLNIGLDDEVTHLGLQAKQALYARHVALKLDAIPVIVARSLTRLDCPFFRQTVLNRGSRSLGLTLFNRDYTIMRQALSLHEIDPNHPLFSTLARPNDPYRATHYPLRRSRFIWQNEILLLYEILLPALQGFQP